MRSTYTNPVGDGIEMGDPFVLRTGDSYFLYGTTDEAEGFRVWESSNLVDWEERGFALRKRSDSWGHRAFWAPEVIQRGGWFYMVYSAAPREGTFRVCIAVSSSPKGPFTDIAAPLFDPGYGCIDGHIFVDHDGTPYLFYSQVGAVGTPSRTETTGYMYGIIRVVELARDLTGVHGKHVECCRAEQEWEQPESSWSRCNEGPFVLRSKGRYILTYSAGHFLDPQYGVGFCTAPSPRGPWIKRAGNSVLARDQDARVSGPGHSCIVPSPDGSELFIVYHAHADPSSPSGRRVVCIDRLRITPDGDIQVDGPTRTPQAMPSVGNGPAGQADR